MTSIVTLKDVAKYYGRGRQKVGILHHLDMEVAAGEFLAFMGPSDKTILLNSIGQLDQSEKGQGVVAGERIDEEQLSDKQRNAA